MTRSLYLFRYQYRHRYPSSSMARSLQRRRRLFSSFYTTATATDTATATATATASAKHHRRGGGGGSVSGVKEVTKANFTTALEEIKEHIRDSHFIAVSSQKTGGAFSSGRGAAGAAPWRHRIFPLDTPETAYLKAKDAAERFELLQFAVCPFRIQGSKIIAFPYNFHLFPRDELNIGMPSYSFSCQTSCLTSMAREGFDFNACIYDGISYLSRVQESAAKGRIQNPIPSICTMKSSSSPSVADSIFMKRIKSRVQHWRDACKDSTKTTDVALVRSLRKLILGGEFYGSRPCMNIDVSTDRQVLLVAEILSEFSDDLVPLMIPDKGGEPKAVRVVLTSSEEDRNLLKSELQHLEEEQDKQVRGFREVIDAITASCKPVVAYNCLTEFTFIHSKFIAPLPPSVEEFMCSLRMVFSNILDLNHLLKEVGPLKKAKNLPAAVSYLKRQFFIPLDMEIPHQAHQGNLGKNHNLLKITLLFAKLCSILKITPACETVASHRTAALEDYANVFYPCCSSSLDPLDGDVGAWAAAYPAKKLSTENLVFLWGFRSGISTRLLKGLLYGTHKAFSEDFEVRLVDKSSAVVVFQRPGSAESFLKDMQGSSGAVGVSALREMISEGLKAAGYEAYRRVCRLGLWEASLADSLDRALSEQQPTCALSMDYCIKDTSDIFWSNDSMIQLNDL